MHEAAIRIETILCFIRFLYFCPDMSGNNPTSKGVESLRFLYCSLSHIQSPDSKIMNVFNKIILYFRRYFSCKEGVLSSHYYDTSTLVELSFLQLLLHQGWLFADTQNRSKAFKSRFHRFQYYSNPSDTLSLHDFRTRFDFFQWLLHVFLEFNFPLHLQ